MEKSSPSPPGGQVIEPTPLRSRLSFGRYQWVQWMTPARAKAIANDPDRLKDFRRGKLLFAHLARLADVDGQGGSFPSGRSAIDDVRDAMKAGDVELFFTVLTLWPEDAFGDCRRDPAINDMLEGWGKAARRGDRTARSLLERIGRALTTAPAHLRHKKTVEQKREQKAIYKAVARIKNTALQHQSKGLKDSRQAWRQALDDFFSHSRMNGKREERVWEKLHTLPEVQVLRSRKGGGTLRKVSPP